MPITHTISLSCIGRGDHIYVRQGVRNRMQRHGIVVAGSDFDRVEQWLVIYPKQQIGSDNFELCLVTLDEFIYPRLKIRRTLYGQGGVLLHHCKLAGTSYVPEREDPDVIVNNTRILYETSRLPFCDKKKLMLLIGLKYEKFSYICSTTNSKNWQVQLESPFSNDQSSSNIMPPTSDPNSSDKKVSNINDTTGSDV